MKICPVCKSRCFDDMDTCYGCLYDFKKNNPVKSSNLNISETKQRDELYLQNNSDNTPEYFEMEPFIYFEDENNNMQFQQPKVSITKNRDKITITIPKQLIQT